MVLKHTLWHNCASLALFLVVSSILSSDLCEGLYEDQAGKFDWRHQYVGKVSQVTFDQPGMMGKRIIVATEQNVLAAINARNGQLGWRQILEKAEDGKVDDMVVMNNFAVVLSSTGGFVRGFHTISGNLLWEATIAHAQSADQGSKLEIFGDNKEYLGVLSDGTIVVLNLESGSEVWSKELPNSETVNYRLMFGRGSDLYVVGLALNAHAVQMVFEENGALRSQDNIPAAWIRRLEQCALISDSLVCLESESDTLHNVKLGGSDKKVFSTTLLKDLGLGSQAKEIQCMDKAVATQDGLPMFVLRFSGSHLAVLSLGTNNKPQLIKDLPGTSVVQAMQYSDVTALLTLGRTDSDNAIVQGFDADTGDSLTDLNQAVHFPSHHGLPLRIEGVVYKRKDGHTGMRVLVASEDHSLLLFQQAGKVLWLREEALASIVSVEMVDLPVSQIMAKMEDEFGSQKDDIISMFIKRFKTQFQQLKTFVILMRQRLRAVRHHHHHQVEEAEVEQDDDADDDEEDDQDYLTRDDFNLHKMIVAVTSCSKVFGLDSQTGHVVWRQYIPDLVPFKQNGPFGKQGVLPLYVQRTTAHFPHQPQCSILGQNRVTGQSILFTFHPISGAAEEAMPTGGYQLNHKVLQATLLTQVDDDFLRPLLVLDHDHKFHVYPKSAVDIVRDLAPSIFLFTSDADKGILQGYSVMNSGGDLVGQSLWNLDLKKETQLITHVVPKRPEERVHSQGIVLGDRSVMYKYLNPNLVVVITEGEDPQSKGFFNVYLVDAVSGQMVFHCSHKRAKGPINIVHSENWVVYNYWNQKHRRVELAILEMYEGKTQSNATAFSSLHPPPPPIVMRQAYIFPGHISAMAATITEIGITSKHILIALESGGVLELAKAFLDPRRPEIPTADTREEGLLPYIPELPRPFEATINYNHSVYNIRGIHTAPAGLESTCLVLAYGLDLFYDKVMPSRMFDVLKDDFDYFFIGSVVVGMILLSIITQKLAARKALNKAWK